MSSHDRGQLGGRESRPRRILYVVGCGRSGSTILGFALGNLARAIDLGEVLDFVKFRGQPNGFGPETDNYRFWSGLLTGIEKRLGKRIDFDRLRSLQARVDTHTALLLALIPGWRQAERAEWRTFLRALYDTLLDDPRFDIIVDSSKYPSRLWHLQSIYDERSLHVIHLLRDPLALARAFGTGEQSVSRGFVPSMMYYLYINASASLLTLGEKWRSTYRLFYEDFVADPESQLRRICEAFEFDPGASLTLIREERPLPRGFIFNGNRMRVLPSIVLKKRARDTLRELGWRRRVADVAVRLFRSETGSPNSRQDR